MQQLQVKCRFFLFVITLSASLTISCNRSAVNQSDEAVSWPQLVRFDEIAYRADGFARPGDLASVREFRDEILKAGGALTTSSVPLPAVDFLAQVEREVGGSYHAGAVVQDSSGVEAVGRNAGRILARFEWFLANSTGVCIPRLLCGRTWLYFRFQSFTTTRY